jgi:hypothetical protein
MMRLWRIVIWIATFTFVTALSEGQNQPKVEPAPQANAAGQQIDKEKAADIRKLLDLVGVRDLVAQSFGGTTEQIRPLVTNSLPPGAYREKLVDLFFAKFQSKIDMDQFLNLAVPIYDKYFTHDEIKALNVFYQTPLGQKSITVLPKLTGELQTAGQKWGADLGRESMREVLAEHPDLAAAMEAASKANTGH